MPGWVSCTFLHSCIALHKRMQNGYQIIHVQGVFPEAERMRKEMNRFQELGSPHYLKNAFKITVLLKQKVSYAFLVHTSAIHLYTWMKHSNSKGRSIFIHPILKRKKEKTKQKKTLVSLQYRFIFSEQTVPHIKSIKPYYKVWNPITKWKLHNPFYRNRMSLKFSNCRQWINYIRFYSSVLVLSRFVSQGVCTWEKSRSTFYLSTSCRL